MPPAKPPVPPMTNHLDMVVLAAGMGSRYGGLKQIESVGPHGELVIDYAVYDAMRAGFQRVVFVIRKDLEEAFRDRIGRAMEKRVDVAYAFQSLDDLPAGFSAPPERKKPWGTGHAVLAARNVLTHPFAVINADDFYGPAAFRLLAAHLQQQPARDIPCHAMVAYELKRTVSRYGTVSRGLCRSNEHGLLVGIEEVAGIGIQDNTLFSPGTAGERRLLDGSTPTSMNCWGFFPDVLNALNADFSRFLEQHLASSKAEFYLPVAVNDMISTHRAEVKVLTTPDTWFGVTYREDKPSVMAGIQATIADGLYPANLWQ